jgi:TetR/AcrR family transcriptional regulator
MAASNKSGERKTQILQTLAEMLEHPKGERITTAALAARLQVSEAALYRHFASKAQMFEGLIEFIENSVFGLVNVISETETSGKAQTRKAIVMLLSFAERNKGMTRVLIGDALVSEDERLQERMNQFYDRIEASLRQCLRNAMALNELPATDDIHARANLILHFVLGRWQRFAKTGWKKSPTEYLNQQIQVMMS